MSSYTQSFRGILQKQGKAYFLFSSVFAFLLVLSQVLLLPQLTRLPIAGTVIDVRSVPAYHKELRHEVEELEAKRDSLVFPQYSALYTALSSERELKPSLRTVLHTLEDLAHQIVPGNASAVQIQKIELHGSTVHMEGVVQGVGTRSTTVLAQFTEAIRQLSEVESVTPPAFTREGSPGAFFSPFSFSFTWN